MAKPRKAQMAMVAIWATGAFAACLVVLHLIQPETDPIAQVTSQYANGRFGWLMTLAFLSISAATAALLAALAGHRPRGRAALAGMAFLAVWAVTPVIAAVFAIDPPGAAPSRAGAIHEAAGGIGFLCLSLGGILLSLALAAAPGWEGRRRVLRTLAALFAFGWVAGALTIPNGSAVAGLVQRAVLALAVVWYVVVAAGLRQNAGR